MFPGLLPPGSKSPGVALTIAVRSHATCCETWGQRTRSISAIAAAGFRSLWPLMT